eukprot:XP_011670890.1 PREDICTED: uncharacterized protein LOC105441466 [Strongylocentrotus purpuratus]
MFGQARETWSFLWVDGTAEVLKVSECDVECRRLDECHGLHSTCRAPVTISPVIPATHFLDGCPRCSPRGLLDLEGRRESRRGRRIYLRSELFYFSGSCGTDEAKLEIAEAFLEKFRSSVFSDSCTEDDDCTVNNVRVTCGPSSRRTRKRRRFYIETNLIVGENQTDYDAALDAEEKMIGLVESLIEDGQLDLSSSVDGFTAVLDESSFNYEYVELVCAPPYTANNDVYRCVPCGRGSYYGNETQECIRCEIGTYQDTHGESTCHQCPEGQSTIGVGSKNVTQCIGICQPGYSSFTGLAPCNHCPIGSYQEEFFATECTSCPVGTATLYKGSTLSRECIGMKFTRFSFVQLESTLQQALALAWHVRLVLIRVELSEVHVINVLILMSVITNRASTVQAASMELAPSRVSVNWDIQGLRVVIRFYGVTLIPASMEGLVWMKSLSLHACVLQDIQVGLAPFFSKCREIKVHSCGGDTGFTCVVPTHTADSSPLNLLEEIFAALLVGILHNRSIFQLRAYQ